MTHWPMRAIGGCLGGALALLLLINWWGPKIAERSGDRHSPSDARLPVTPSASSHKEEQRRGSRLAPLHISATDAPPYSPTIRVNLTPNAVKSLTLGVDAPYRVRPIGSPQILLRGDRLSPTAVEVTATGLRIGQQQFPVARLQIEAAKPPAIWVDDHQYRGRICLYRRPGGTILAVNELPLEDYLASVVDSEMPAAFPQSARQAQAIVARTYALYHMQQARSHPFFDLFATSRSQRYLGYQYRDRTGRRLAGETVAGREIVRQTAGLVCTWQGKLFSTYYSAVCGGRTMRGTELFSDAAPPLQSVACRWCSEAELYRWERDVHKQQASENLKRLFTARMQPFDSLAAIRPVPEEQPGDMAIFEVGDGLRTHRLTGDELRRHLHAQPLPSPHFQIIENGERLMVRGRGHGHGVGFCQWGARGLAQADHDCLSILQIYYPGGRVVRLESPKSGRM